MPAGRPLCVLSYDETARRIYICGWHCHHGFTGLALILTAAVLRLPPLALIGLILCWHDRHDFPWLKD